MKRKHGWVAVLAATLTVAPLVAGQQPTSVPGGGNPLPSESARDFNKALETDYWSKLPQVTGEKDSNGRLLDPNGNPIGTTTTMGLMMIRDMYAVQSRQFSDGLQALKDKPRSEKAADLDALRKAAAELDNLHQNVVGMERSIAELEARASSGPGSFSAKDDYEKLLERAKEADKNGDTARAAELRHSIARHPWGLLQERRRAYYEALDKNPVLGIYHNGRYFWQALRESTGGAADGMQLYNDYLNAGQEKALAEAKRAEGVTTVTGLWEFGGSKYARQQRTWTIVGGAVGSVLPGMLMNEVKDVRTGSDSGALTSAQWTDFWLNVTAGGAVLIPGVGPFITAGIVAYQVTRDGADLVITLLDEKAARESAGTTGHIHVITEEDRRAAAAGKFALSLVTSLGDLSAVKNIKVVRRTESGAARAADAAGDAERSAARSGGTAPDPNKTLPPGAVTGDAGQTLAPPSTTGDAGKTLAPPGADPGKTLPPGEVTGGGTTIITTKQPGSGVVTGDGTTIITTKQPGTGAVTGDGTTIITTKQPGTGAVTGDGTTIITRGETGGGGAAAVDPNKTLPPGAAADPGKTATGAAAQPPGGDGTTIITTKQPGAGVVTGDGTTIITKGQAEAGSTVKMDPNATAIQPPPGDKTIVVPERPTTGTPEAAASGDKTHIVPDEPKGKLRGDDPNKPKPSKPMSETQQNDAWNSLMERDPLEGLREESEGALRAGADPEEVRSLREAAEKGDEVAGYELAKLRRRLEGYDVRKLPGLGTEEFQDIMKMRMLYTRYQLGTLSAKDFADLQDLLRGDPNYFKNMARRRYTPEQEFDPKTDRPGVKPKGDETFLPVIPPNADVDAFEAAVRAGRTPTGPPANAVPANAGSPGAPAGGGSGAGTSPAKPDVPGPEVAPPADRDFRPSTGGIRRSADDKKEREANDKKEEDNRTATGASGAGGAASGASAGNTTTTAVSVGDGFNATTEISPISIDLTPGGEGAATGTANATGSGGTPVTGGRYTTGGNRTATGGTATGTGTGTGAATNTAMNSTAPGLGCDLPGGCVESDAMCDGGYDCRDLSHCVYPECDYLVPSSESARDPDVQIMILEKLLLRLLPGAQLVPKPFGWDGGHGIIGAIWRTLMPRAAGGMVLSSSTGRWRSGAGLAAQSQSQSQQRTRVQTVLTSLGRSTGEAFQIQVLNPSNSPVLVGANALIVEPIKQSVKQQVQKQIAQVASSSPVTSTLGGYCLEFARQPPTAGTLFRIASPALQRKYEPMRRVLQAAQRLERDGLLRHDGNPVEYINSIKQWALWAREQKFDLKDFGKAFIDHAKKNVAAAGRPWSSDVEKALKALVPHRWEQIAMVLQAAESQPRQGAGDELR